MTIIVGVIWSHVTKTTDSTAIWGLTLSETKTHVKGFWS